MKRSTTRDVAIGLSLAVGLAGVVGFLAFRTIQRLTSSVDWVEQTHLVLEAIGARRIALTRSDAAGRMYLLTGDSLRLADYLAARADADAATRSIRQLTLDDSLPQRRLDQLDQPLAAGLSRWDSLIQARGRMTSQAQRDSARLAPSVAAPAIRLLDQLEADERRLLQSRLLESESSVWATAVLTAATFTAALAVLAVTCVLLRDNILARARAESEQARLQLFLDSIIENIPLMVLVKDADELRFVRLNQAGEVLLGRPRSEVIGRNDYDLFPRDQADGFTAKDRETLHSGRLVTVSEEAIQTAHRGERLLQTRKMAIHDRDGRPQYLLGISEDITERRGAEERLRVLNQALVQRTAALESANRELESFSYSVSHDLRAPLRAIEGFSRILQEDYAPILDPEAQRLFTVVRSNVGKLGRLIDDLLRFSRAGRQELVQQMIDMDALVRSQLAELAQTEPGRRIHVTVERLPEVRADPSLVREVTANLLGNAWKFTRGKEPATIRIEGRRQGHTIEYTVADNGAGFDMKYAGRLFGVFQRLHREDQFEGTGVGLALVQRIIQRHGGRVWAEAVPGEGATFYFTLPAQENGQ